MTKLKIATLADDKPVKVVLELPAAVHRDLVAYAEILARQSGHPAHDPAKLIVPMLAKFMATDRAFAKSRKSFLTAEGRVTIGTARAWGNFQDGMPTHLGHRVA